MITTLFLVVMIVVLFIFLLACCKVAGEADDHLEGFQIVSPCYIPEEHDDIHPDPLFTADVTDEEIILAAKTLWGEAHGVESRMEQAAVVWTMLNRVDAFGDSLGKIVTASNQFAYDEDNPTIDDFDRDLTELVRDVVGRWESEKNGVDSGRVLPKQYLWFGGDGEQNYFRSEYDSFTDIWDWSLPNPYTEG